MLNSVQALNLIGLLQTQKIDYSKPVKSQLSKFFVPTFWNGNLVLRTSYKGRIASFLERPTEYISNNKKIFYIFSEAIRSVINDPFTCEKLDPSLGFKLVEELCDGKISLKRNELAADILSSSETKVLKKQKEEKMTAYWNKIKSLSFLHKLTKNSLSVDLKSLQALKSSNAETYPFEALNFLEQFIINNPSYAVSDWESKLKRIRGACLLDEKIISQFQNHSSDLKLEKKANNTPEFQQLLLAFSAEFTNQVGSLDGFKGEKKLLHFSFGPKNLTIGAFLELLRKVPDPALESVSEEYKQLLLNDDLESIDKIGEKVVRIFFNKIKFSQTTISRLRPLGRDPERRTPDVVASKLPKLFEIWLENFLKKGIVGNASSLLPKEYGQVFEWISENSDFLQDAISQKKIEDQFVEIFKSHFRSFHQKYSNAFINFFRMSQTVISPQLMELLGIDHLMMSGPLWLEFEKKTNKTFNINVYTLGNSLNYQPFDPHTGTRYAVMRLSNVKPEKLNQQFFFSLLKRHVDPLNDPLSASKAYDIYTGPLKTLEATVDNNLPNDPKGLESIPPTNWQLSLNLLLKQDDQRHIAKFQVYFQALIGFCRSHMINGQLNIQDVETCKTLESVLSEVNKYLKQVNLTSTEIKEIKATCTEVRHSIFNCYEKLNKKPIDIKIATLVFDKELLKSLREYILGFNITQKQLLEYREAFTYFLGDEVGEFIDHMLEHSSHLFREDLSPMHERSGGYFDQLYIGMYANAIRHALPLVAIGIGLASGGWMSLLAFGGFWYILPVPVIDKILPYILPPRVLEGYERIKDALLRKYYELLVWGSLALIPRSQRERIKKQILEWRKTVIATTAMLQGQRKLNYWLANPIPKSDKNRVSKHINISSNLFNTGLRGLNRFCKVNKLSCQALEGTNYISTITFNKDLSFTIKPNSAGILEAVSEKFPGFHIAEEQHNGTLEGIPCYLLLQNNNDQKKVLIPKKQWMQTLIGRMSQLAGPFSEIWMDAAASINSTNDEYFTFTLEPCRYLKEKMILKSSDLEATLYLLCLYYILNKKKALNQVEQHFNWLCNIKPISSDILTQLVPLSLIPFNFAGLIQFRRKLFSVISQNQLRFGVKEDPDFKDQTTYGKNLILGIVALTDLNAYFENKASRENLSFHEVYFLYKFAFKMLSSILKKGSQEFWTSLENGGLHDVMISMGLSGNLTNFLSFILKINTRRLNKAAEIGQFEHLIEVIGLSSPLNDHYLEIKKRLGIKESWSLWIAKKGVEILRTSSTLPNYVNSGDRTEVYHSKNEKWNQFIPRLLSYFRDVKYTYLKSLKPDELIKFMSPDLKYIPTLNPIEMTPEILQKYFPVYFSIARNDSLVNYSFSERCQLIYALSLLKGIGNKQSQLLVSYLHTAVLYEVKCPSTERLVLALNKVKNRSHESRDFKLFF